jgi:hypothetical protein
VESVVMIDEWFDGWINWSIDRYLYEHLKYALQGIEYDNLLIKRGFRFTLYLLITVHDFFFAVSFLIAHPYNYYAMLCIRHSPFFYFIFSFRKLHSLTHALSLHWGAQGFCECLPSNTVWR